MSNVVDIDARRSNQELMDIEVRYEKNKLFHDDCLKKNARVKRTNDPGVRGPTWKKEDEEPLWKPGDEPGNLGFQDGTEYD